MTRDIAAHLILREHDHLADPGLVLPVGWAVSAPCAYCWPPVWNTRSSPVDEFLPAMYLDHP